MFPPWDTVQSHIAEGGVPFSDLDIELETPFWCKRVRKEIKIMNRTIIIKLEAKFLFEKKSAG